jgi:hypothetical protein
MAGKFPTSPFLDSFRVIIRPRASFFASYNPVFWLVSGNSTSECSETNDGCRGLGKNRVARKTLVPGRIERHETVCLRWIALSRITSHYRIRENGAGAPHHSVAQSSGD